MSSEPTKATTSFFSSVWLRFALSTILLLTILVYLGNGHGDKPALGPLLSPYHGLWNHKLSFWENSPNDLDLKLAGLKAPVKIQVDQDQIKHIFAQDDEDLYFAEGYVVASERLWEMEFLARVAAGRLSEIMGRRTLEFDKYFVKLGLPEAAKESAALMMADPATSVPLKAYAAGVNAYISSLNPETFPFEYKLLGLTPEPWKAENAALLIKFLAYDLSGSNRELLLSRSRSMITREDFDDLFPLDLHNEEPIVPKGKKFSFETRAGAGPKDEFLPDLKPLEPVPQPNQHNGSNNWAVMAKKSTTGRPILSNDIHLSLTLPALWYEIQLQSPEQNVYGIALPGAPGVVLGFNPTVAWGVTNAGSDVMDWYQLRYRDQNRSEYLFEGDWRPVISREVQIKIRGEAAPLTLLLRQTHMGPIVYDQSENPVNPSVPRGLAMRWAALEPSNELKNFLQLNRAKTTSQCREAIETVQTPAQNFLCADESGDVGLWHMGRFPVRFPGQGRTISDGSSAAYEWKGWVPRTEVPFIRNPDRGFVSSANQIPADETYPNYLGWPYETPFRGTRINELLREKKKLSPQDLMAMQGDTVSLLAREALPLLLAAVDEHQMNWEEQKAVELLKVWKYDYPESSEPAAIFDAWWNAFETQTWQPHFPDRKYYQYPPIVRTLELMKEDPDSKWFDNPQTHPTERFKDVALSSFRLAMESLTHDFGPMDEMNWAWKKAHKTELTHISKIPGLGSNGFSAPGVGESIFANRGTHGPVWKMVVALGSKPQAWAIYPGGQSGDPASAHYDDFLQSWRMNQLKEVNFMTSPTDTDKRKFKTVTLDGKAETKQ